MNNFFKNIRKDTIKRLELLELQKKFEDGLISENNMNEAQKVDLEKLYDEQIQELDYKIQRKENELKRKIIQNNEYYKIAIKMKEANNN